MSIYTTEIGFKAAFVTALEHTFEAGEHTCRLTADGEPLLESDLAGMDR